VVEWGEGLVEGLAEDRLLVGIERGTAENDEARTVTLRGVGARWDGVPQQLAG
jgi:tRNA threonylcarbamoyladenosine biosynthesis protein TsaE